FRPFGRRLPNPGAMPHAYALQTISQASPRADEGAAPNVGEAVPAVRKPAGPKDFRRHAEALARDRRLFAHRWSGLEPCRALTPLIQTKAIRSPSGLPVTGDSQIERIDGPLSKCNERN